MLGSMRASKKNQTLVWVIFGLLVIGLIGFGGATSGPGTIRSVAQVGDEKISVDSYVAAVQNRIQVVSQQFGRNLSGPEAQALGVQQAVLSELITSAAIDNEAAKIGLSLGDEAVRSELLTTDAFLGLDGKFNKESYNFVLERSQLSPAQYDEILRKDAARTMVNTAITSGVGAQDSQTLQILNYVAEQRDFSWVELTNSDLDSPITPPNETEIQAQYDANTAAYTAPLTRKITYVLLTPEMLESEAEIDEADLQEAYKLQNDRFNQTERRLVERLVFSDQAEAETARNALDAGTKTFDDLLKERGLSATDADLGEIEINDVSKDAATVVFGSSDAGVVGPAQSSLGPALYRINAILKAESTSFEEARDELTAELAGEITRRMLNDMVDDIDDLLAAGAALEEVASDTAMQLATVDFSANSNDGISAYDSFRKIANATNEKDFPEINSLSDGGIFALRVDAIVEPTLRPLDEVKTLVITDWTKEATLKALEAKAEMVIKGFADSKSFTGLQAKSETEALRNNVFENLPAGLSNKIFKLDTGNATAMRGTDSVFVAGLDAITPFDPDTAENQILVETIQSQIKGQLANDLMTIYAETLREDAGLSINQTAINQINAQILGSN